MKKVTVCNHSHAISFVGKFVKFNKESTYQPAAWVACNSCDTLLDGIVGNKDIREDERGIWDGQLKAIIPD